MQMQINLLPVHYRPKPPVRLWPVIITIALVVNLLLISVYWLTLYLDLTETQTNLRTTEQEVANLQRQVDEAQWKADLELAVKKKGDYIQGAVDEHFIWHPVVAALERAMVPGVRLDTVQFLASGDVNITGRTDTVKLAADFWGSIQAETGLKIVRLTTVQAESSFNMILRGSDGWPLEQEEKPEEETEEETEQGEDTEPEEEGEPEEEKDED